MSQEGQEEARDAEVRGTEMMLNEVASTGPRAPRIVRGHRRDTQTKLIEKASWEDF